MKQSTKTLALWLFVVALVALGVVLLNHPIGYVILGMVGLFFIYFIRELRRGRGKTMSFGKSRAKILTREENAEKTKV